MTVRRLSIMFGLLSAVFIISAAVPGIRHGILRQAGWILVVNDSIEPADVVVIAVDANGAGALEAADLIHERISKKVAVFADPPDYVVENEFIRRGASYEGGAERSIRELRALGVAEPSVIPGYVEGSADEGPALSSWSDQQQFHSVIVVTIPDHSRRLRRTLHRASAGHHMRIAVRSAHYSMFDPNHWWQTHGGMRTEIEEFEKLMLDVVRHPLS